MTNTEEVDQFAAQNERDIQQIRTILDTRAGDVIYLVDTVRLAAQMDCTCTGYDETCEPCYAREALKACGLDQRS